jgi:hypothetical protein
MEKSKTGKQIPTLQDIKSVMPNQRQTVPMMGSRRINQARAASGMGRQINNLANPMARQSKYS